MTTNSIGLTIPIPAAQGGTGTVGTGILDTNGNEVITYPATASAVNHVEFINAATGVNPQVLARGDDTNIILQLGGKGTGGAAIVGTSTNDDAGAAYVGQQIAATVLTTGAVSLTTDTPANVTSISLTAGDWDVWGNVYIAGSAAVVTMYISWISTTSATVPNLAHTSIIQYTDGAFNIGTDTPNIRLSLNTTTTVYLSGQATISSGTATACGNIFARRRR